MRTVMGNYIRGVALTIILAIAAGLAAGGIWVVARRASTFWAVTVQGAVLVVFIASFFATSSNPPSDGFRVVAGALTGVAVAMMVTSVSDLRKVRARRSQPDAAASGGGENAPLSR